MQISLQVDVNYCKICNWSIFHDLFCWKNIWKLRKILRICVRSFVNSHPVHLVFNFCFTIIKSKQYEINIHRKKNKSLDSDTIYTSVSQPTGRGGFQTGRAGLLQNDYFEAFLLKLALRKACKWWNFSVAGRRYFYFKNG